MKSLTVLIPMYDETVYYSAEELVADTKHGNQQTDEKSISLIEFLVEKHKVEFNNLAARIKFPSSNSAGLNPDGLSASASALLDEFLFRHSNPTTHIKDGSTVAIPEDEWKLFENEVIDWCSYRGQTLARTVRGINYIRDALKLFAAYELAGESEAIESVIRDKFQLIIAAQIFGSRSETVHRAAIRRLCQHFPYIEIVYNYDVNADMKERIKMKTELLRTSTRVGLIIRQIDEQQLIQTMDSIQKNIGPVTLTQTDFPSTHDDSVNESVDRLVDQLTIHLDSFQALLNQLQLQSLHQTIDENDIEQLTKSKNDDQQSKHVYTDLELQAHATIDISWRETLLTVDRILALIHFIPSSTALRNDIFRMLVLSDQINCYQLSTTVLKGLRSERKEIKQTEQALNDFAGEAEKVLRKQFHSIQVRNGLAEVIELQNKICLMFVNSFRHAFCRRMISTTKNILKRLILQRFNC